MKFQELSALYQQPLFDLISQSRVVHLQHWRGEEVQRCSLLSIKTGGCSEDCAYCAQSAHYSTGVDREELLSVENVLAAARRARSQGAGRFCMGAAWRGVRDGSEKFEHVLEIVRRVSHLGMEVCVTLGEIGPVEARKLKAAGVTAYNHNIDTSPEFYPEIVSTHTFQNRLDTIAAVQGQRDVGLLRRDHRHGRIGGRSSADAGSIEQFRSASRKRPDQLLDADAGHTAGRSTAAGYFRVGETDRRDPDCLAEGARSSGGGTHATVARRSGALLFRRRQFHFLRGQTSHGEKSRCGCRCCLTARTWAARGINAE